ncbi:MAG: sulfatase [Deltaproteobacteria bacterium]|nr:sulfatase [Deltaproteobacteria bacterium]
MRSPCSMHLCRILLAILASTMGVACGPGEELPLPAEELASLLGPSRPLRIKLSQSEIRLDIHPLEGILTARSPLLIGKRQVLEFIPLLHNAPRPGCTVTLEAESDGGTRTLWNGEPGVMSVRSSGFALHGDFPRPQRIDLADLAGEVLRLSWKSSEGCKGRQISLSRVRIVPVAERVAPPILLICSDQHRYDYALGAQGREHMPEFQQFAAQSVVYPRAYSNASWTLPSIVSTLTGIHPRFHRTGVRVEEGTDWDSRRKLPPGQFRIQWGDTYYVFSAYAHDLETLGERLQRRGYATEAVVSNTFYSASGLLKDGFDLAIDSRAVEGSVINQLAGWLLRRRDPDVPFFLLVHYMDVHEYLNWAPGGNAIHDLDPDERAKQYAFRVRETDRHLSHLLKLWDRTVGLKDSLVIFFSDHGEHLSEPGRLGERHGGSMDDVLLRVPLVVHYPESLGVEPGTDDREAALVDLVPTVLAVVGAEDEEGMLHGSSLLGAPASSAARPIFADFQLKGDDLSALRVGPDKLLVNWRDGARTLLRPGPYPATVPEDQWRVEEPARQAALEELFDAYLAEAESFSAGIQSDVVIDQDDLTERLKAIGYVQ